ncbi:DUF6446 family protein [Aestuariibius sp. 2305UL40-4]|uniref:DUF6446 family protein n=1 Tax=Aestuariibius violaceus TaxID=3234132 RepID=UPI00398E895F
MAIVLTAAIAGAAMYYFQVYAFYEELPEGEVVLTTVGGVEEPILADGFAGIDSESSPLRYRACFETPQSLAMLTETHVIRDDAAPRNAPGWFGCFDAEAIGAAVESGEAVVFLGTENIVYGVDRVFAIFPDGRGYGWHEINACGEVVFDGQPVPEDCPDPDDFPVEQSDG